MCYAVHVDVTSFPWVTPTDGFCGLRFAPPTVGILPPLTRFPWVIPTVGILPALTRFNWYCFGSRGLRFAPPTAGFRTPRRGSCECYTYSVGYTHPVGYTHGWGPATAMSVGCYPRLGSCHR